MEKIRQFLARKDVVFTLQRYGIDALGAMAQGLFCTLLVGTILNTLGQQFGIGFLTRIIVTVGKGEGRSGLYHRRPCLRHGRPRHCRGHRICAALPDAGAVFPDPVGFAANAMGGAGGPLAVSSSPSSRRNAASLWQRETKIDILVTPIVTVLAGIGIARLVAAPIGTAASAVGSFIKWATVASALFHGHCGIRRRGRGADTAHFLRRHLRSAGTDRACRRRRRGRVLRPDGGLRGDELPGKRLGRSGRSGHRHQHAANA